MTPLGEVLRDARGARLEFVREYDVPVEELWSAVTESDRLARWLGSWTGGPAVGGTMLFTMLHEAQECAPEPVTIVECAPPRRLVVEWPVSREWPWRLELTLAATTTGSVLTFAQPLHNAVQANDIGPGWHWYLDRLASVVHHTPMPVGWDDFYTPELRRRYRQDMEGTGSPLAT